MAKQGSTPNPTSTKENTPTISVLQFNEFQTALRNSFESTEFSAHPPLLIHTGNAPKPSEYQIAGEALASSNKQAFCVGKPSGKNQILSQSLLGIDSKDVQCKWILLGPAAIEALKATKEVPNTLFELYYQLEKTTLSYNTYELSSAATPDSFKSTFSTWQSAWVKEGKSGVKFFSQSFKRKDEPYGETPKRAARVSDDEIPFD